MGRLLRSLKEERRNENIALWIGVFLLMNCVSLAAVLHNHTSSWWSWLSMMSAIALTLFIPLFTRARFSFGYIVSFNFYCLIASYLWISPLIIGDYDHIQGSLSATSSLLFVLLPLLFQVHRLRPRFTLSRTMMTRAMLAVMGFALVVLAWNAIYGFAIVSIAEADRLRETLLRPRILSYIDGWFVCALLPFAFAWFAAERHYIWATTSVLLIAAFYPVLLNKTVVFSGIWLPFLFILFSLFDARRATVLSLLVPLLVGLFSSLVSNLLGLFPKLAVLVFGSVNYRMMAFPAMALDRYFDFFAHHDLTRFCQIGIIRSITGCPYQFQLGAELERYYDMGNLNGSLFASEGIASVGPVFAPLSALTCGLILSIGNSVSAHLPKRFVATSAGVALQVLVNVPLSASLLSNGLLVLFLLWHMTPVEDDSLFEVSSAGQGNPPRQIT